MNIHDYLSTACLHQRHDYCNAMTGVQGTKRPAQCKWCEARCRCDCHVTPAGDRPIYATAIP